MKYITYKRFKDKALCGNVNIPAMTECQEYNGILFYNSIPLCLATSENAHTYFAINEDGMGLKRGAIIYDITTMLKRKDSKYQNRWDKVWEDKLCQKYKRHEHPEHWLWNHEFYNADINDLEYILALIKEIG
jgi:hypothetical protein